MLDKLWLSILANVCPPYIGYTGGLDKVCSVFDDFDMFLLEFSPAYSCCILLDRPEVFLLCIGVWDRDVHSNTVSSLQCLYSILIWRYEYTTISSL